MEFLVGDLFLTRHYDSPAALPVSLSQRPHGEGDEVPPLPPAPMLPNRCNNSSSSVALMSQPRGTSNTGASSSGLLKHLNAPAGTSTTTPAAPPALVRCSTPHISPPPGTRNVTIPVHSAPSSGGPSVSPSSPYSGVGVASHTLNSTTGGGGGGSTGPPSSVGSSVGIQSSSHGGTAPQAGVAASNTQEQQSNPHGAEMQQGVSSSLPFSPTHHSYSVPTSELKGKYVLLFIPPPRDVLPSNSNAPTSTPAVGGGVTTTSSGKYNTTGNSHPNGTSETNPNSAHAAVSHVCRSSAVAESNASVTPAETIGTAGGPAAPPLLTPASTGVWGNNNTSGNTTNDHPERGSGAGAVLSNPPPPTSTAQPLVGITNTGTMRATTAHNPMTHASSHALPANSSSLPDSPNRVLPLVAGQTPLACVSPLDRTSSSCASRHLSPTLLSRCGETPTLAESGSVSRVALQPAPRSAVQTDHPATNALHSSSGVGRRSVQANNRKESGTVPHHPPAALFMESSLSAASTSPALQLPATPSVALHYHHQSHITATVRARQKLLVFYNLLLQQLRGEGVATGVAQAAAVEEEEARFREWSVPTFKAQHDPTSGQPPHGHRKAGVAQSPTPPQYPRGGTNTTVNGQHSSPSHTTTPEEGGGVNAVLGHNEATNSCGAPLSSLPLHPARSGASAVGQRTLNVSPTSAVGGATSTTEMLSSLMHLGVSGGASVTPAAAAGAGAGAMTSPALAGWMRMVPAVAVVEVHYSSSTLPPNVTPVIRSGFPVPSTTTRIGNDVSGAKSATEGGAVPVVSSPPPSVAGAAADGNWAREGPLANAVAFLHALCMNPAPLSHSPFHGSRPHPGSTSSVNPNPSMPPTNNSSPVPSLKNSFAHGSAAAAPTNPNTNLISKTMATTSAVETTHSSSNFNGATPSAMVSEPTSSRRGTTVLGRTTTTRAPPSGPAPVPPSGCFCGRGMEMVPPVWVSAATEALQFSSQAPLLTNCSNAAEHSVLTSAVQASPLPGLVPVRATPLLDYPMVAAIGAGASSGGPPSPPSTSVSARPSYTSHRGHRHHHRQSSTGRSAAAAPPSQAVSRVSPSGSVGRPNTPLSLGAPGNTSLGTAPTTSIRGEHPPESTGIGVGGSSSRPHGRSSTTTSRSGALRTTPPPCPAQQVTARPEPDLQVLEGLPPLPYAAGLDSDIIENNPFYGGWYTVQSAEAYRRILSACDLHTWPAVVLLDPNGEIITVHGLDTVEEDLRHVVIVNKKPATTASPHPPFYSTHGGTPPASGTAGPLSHPSYCNTKGSSANYPTEAPELSASPLLHPPQPQLNTPRDRVIFPDAVDRVLSGSGIENNHRLSTTVSSLLHVCSGAASHPSGLPAATSTTPAGQGSPSSGPAVAGPPNSNSSSTTWLETYDLASFVHAYYQQAAAAVAANSGQNDYSSARPSRHLAGGTSTMRSPRVTGNGVSLLSTVGSMTMNSFPSSSFNVVSSPTGESSSGVAVLVHPFWQTSSLSPAQRVSDGVSSGSGEQRPTWEEGRQTHMTVGGVSATTLDVTAPSRTSTVSTLSRPTINVLEPADLVDPEFSGDTTVAVCASGRRGSPPLGGKELPLSYTCPDSTAVCDIDSTTEAEHATIPSETTTMMVEEGSSNSSRRRRQPFRVDVHRHTTSLSPLPYEPTAAEEAENCTNDHNENAVEERVVNPARGGLDNEDEHSPGGCDADGTSDASTAKRNPMQPLDVISSPLLPPLSRSRGSPHHSQPLTTGTAAAVGAAFDSVPASPTSTASSASSLISPLYYSSYGARRGTNSILLQAGLRQPRPRDVSSAPDATKETSRAPPTRTNTRGEKDSASEEGSTAVSFFIQQEDSSFSPCLLSPLRSSQVECLRLPTGDEIDRSSAVSMEAAAPQGRAEVTGAKGLMDTANSSGGRGALADVEGTCSAAGQTAAITATSAMIPPPLPRRPSSTTPPAPGSHLVRSSTGIHSPGDTPRANLSSGISVTATTVAYRLQEDNFANGPRSGETSEDETRAAGPCWFMGLRSQFPWYPGRYHHLLARRQAASQRLPGSISPPTGIPGSAQGMGCEEWRSGMVPSGPRHSVVARRDHPNRYAVGSSFIRQLNEDGLATGDDLLMLSEGSEDVLTLLDEERLRDMDAPNDEEVFTQEEFGMTTESDAILQPPWGSGSGVGRGSHNTTSAMAEGMPTPAPIKSQAAQAAQQLGVPKGDSDVFRIGSLAGHHSPSSGALPPDRLTSCSSPLQDSFLTDFVQEERLVSGEISLGSLENVINHAAVAHAAANGLAAGSTSTEVQGGMNTNHSTGMHHTVPMASVANMRGYAPPWLYSPTTSLRFGGVPAHTLGLAGFGSAPQPPVAESPLAFPSGWSASQQYYQTHFAHLMDLSLRVCTALRGPEDEEAYDTQRKRRANGDGTPDPFASNPSAPLPALHPPVPELVLSRPLTGGVVDDALTRPQDTGLRSAGGAASSPPPMTGTTTASTASGRRAAEYFEGEEEGAAASSPTRSTAHDSRRGRRRGMKGKPGHPSAGKGNDGSGRRAVRLRERDELSNASEEDALPPTTSEEETSAFYSVGGRRRHRHSHQVGTEESLVRRPHRRRHHQEPQGEEATTAPPARSSPRVPSSVTSLTASLTSSSFTISSVGGPEDDEQEQQLHRNSATEGTTRTAMGDSESAWLHPLSLPTANTDGMVKDDHAEMPSPLTGDVREGSAVQLLSPASDERNQGRFPYPVPSAEGGALRLPPMGLSENHAAGPSEPFASRNARVLRGGVDGFASSSLQSSGELPPTHVLLLFGAGWHPGLEETIQQLKRLVNGLLRRSARKDVGEARVSGPMEEASTGGGALLGKQESGTVLNGGKKKSKRKSRTKQLKKTKQLSEHRVKSASGSSDARSFTPPDLPILDGGGMGLRAELKQLLELRTEDFSHSQSSGRRTPQSNSVDDSSSSQSGVDPIQLSIDSGFGPLSGSALGSLDGATTASSSSSTSSSSSLSTSSSVTSTCFSSKSDWEGDSSVRMRAGEESSAELPKSGSQEFIRDLRFLKGSGLDTPLDDPMLMDDDEDVCEELKWPKETQKKKWHVKAEKAAAGEAFDPVAAAAAWVLPEAETRATHEATSQLSPSEEGATSNEKCGGELPGRELTQTSSARPSNLTTAHSSSEPPALSSSIGGYEGVRSGSSHLEDRRSSINSNRMAGVEEVVGEDLMVLNDSLFKSFGQDFLPVDDEEEDEETQDDHAASRGGRPRQMAHALEAAVSNAFSFPDAARSPHRTRSAGDGRRSWVAKGCSREMALQDTADDQALSNAKRKRKQKRKKRTTQKNLGGQANQYKSNKTKHREERDKSEETLVEEERRRWANATLRVQIVYVSLDDSYEELLKTLRLLPRSWRCLSPFLSSLPKRSPTLAVGPHDYHDYLDDERSGKEAHSVTAGPDPFGGRITEELLARRSSSQASSFCPSQSPIPLAYRSRSSQEHASVHAAPLGVSLNHPHPPPHVSTGSPLRTPREWELNLKSHHSVTSLKGGDGEAAAVGSLYGHHRNGLLLTPQEVLEVHEADSYQCYHGALGSREDPLHTNRFVSANDTSAAAGTVLTHRESEQRRDAQEEEEPLRADVEGAQAPWSLYSPGITPRAPGTAAARPGSSALQLPLQELNLEDFSGQVTPAMVTAKPIEASNNAAHKNAVDGICAGRTSERNFSFITVNTTFNSANGMGRTGGRRWCNSVGAHYPRYSWNNIFGRAITEERRECDDVDDGVDADEVENDTEYLNDERGDAAMRNEIAMLKARFNVKTLPRLVLLAPNAASPSSSTMNTALLAQSPVLQSAAPLQQSAGLPWFHACGSPNVSPPAGGSRGAPAGLRSMVFPKGAEGGHKPRVPNSTAALVQRSTPSVGAESAAAASVPAPLIPPLTLTEEYGAGRPDDPLTECATIPTLRSTSGQEENPSTLLSARRGESSILAPPPQRRGVSGGSTTGVGERSGVAKVSSPTGGGGWCSRSHTSWRVVHRHAERELQRDGKGKSFPWGVPVPAVTSALPLCGPSPTTRHRTTTLSDATRVSAVVGVGFSREEASEGALAGLTERGIGAAEVCSSAANAPPFDAAITPHRTSSPGAEVSVNAALPHASEGMTNHQTPQRKQKQSERHHRSNAKKTKRQREKEMELQSKRLLAPDAWNLFRASLPSAFPLYTITGGGARRDHRLHTYAVYNAVVEPLRPFSLQQRGSTCIMEKKNYKQQETKEIPSTALWMSPSTINDESAVRALQLKPFLDGSVCVLLCAFGEVDFEVHAESVRVLQHAEQMIRETLEKRRRAAGMRAAALRGTLSLAGGGIGVSAVGGSHASALLYSAGRHGSGFPPIQSLRQSLSFLQLQQQQLLEPAGLGRTPDGHGNATSILSAGGNSAPVPSTTTTGSYGYTSTTPRGVQSSEPPSNSDSTVVVSPGLRSPIPITHTMPPSFAPMKASTAATTTSSEAGLLGPLESSSPHPSAVVTPTSLTVPADEGGVRVAAETGSAGLPASSLGSGHPLPASGGGAIPTAAAGATAAGMLSTRTPALPPQPEGGPEAERRYPHVVLFDTIWSAEEEEVELYGTETPSPGGHAPTPTPTPPTPTPTPTPAAAAAAAAAGGAESSSHFFVSASGPPFTFLVSHTAEPTSDTAGVGERSQATHSSAAQRQSIGSGESKPGGRYSCGGSMVSTPRSLRNGTESDTAGSAPPATSPSGKALRPVEEKKNTTQNIETNARPAALKSNTLELQRKRRQEMQVLQEHVIGPLLKQPDMTLLPVREGELFVVVLRGVPSKREFAVWRQGLAEKYPVPPPITTSLNATSSAAVSEGGMSRTPDVLPTGGTSPSRSPGNSTAPHRSAGLTTTSPPTPLMMVNNNTSGFPTRPPAVVSKSTTSTSTTGSRTAVPSASATAPLAKQQMGQRAMRSPPPPRTPSALLQRRSEPGMTTTPALTATGVLRPSRDATPPPAAHHYDPAVGSRLSSGGASVSGATPPLEGSCGEEPLSSLSASSGLGNVPSTTSAVGGLGKGAVPVTGLTCSEDYKAALPLEPVLWFLRQHVLDMNPGATTAQEL